MDNVVLKLVFVQDLFNIIHRAKHPHFESEIIDQVKNGLISAIREVMNANSAQPAPQPEVKEEAAAEVKEESDVAAV